MIDVVFNTLKQDFAQHPDNWECVYEIQLGTLTDKAVRERVKRFMQTAPDGNYLEVLHVKQGSRPSIRVCRQMEQAS